MRRSSRVTAAPPRVRTESATKPAVGNCANAGIARTASIASLSHGSEPGGGIGGSRCVPPWRPSLKSAIVFATCSCQGSSASTNVASAAATFFAHAERFFQPSHASAAKTNRRCSARNKHAAALSAPHRNEANAAGPLRMRSKSPIAIVASSRYGTSTCSPLPSTRSEWLHAQIHAASSATLGLSDDRSESHRAGAISEPSSVIARRATNALPLPSHSIVASHCIPGGRKGSKASRPALPAHICCQYGASPW